MICSLKSARIRTHCLFDSCFYSHYIIPAPETQQNFYFVAFSASMCVQLYYTRCIPSSKKRVTAVFEVCTAKTAVYILIRNRYIKFNTCHRRFCFIVSSIVNTGQRNTVFGLYLPTDANILICNTPVMKQIGRIH